MHTSVQTGRSNLPDAPATPLRNVPTRAVRTVPGMRSRIPAAARAPEPIDPAFDWRVWRYLTAGIFVLFLLLVNPSWVPSGDGDLYVAIARSVALGQGYTFNGQQVNICPPGWPLLLAGLMQISPTFLTFKLLMVLCMTAQLSMWYWLLRRFVPVIVAASAVAMAALLPHVYSLTFWTHTEAVYCLLATGGMLLALQIAENRGGLAWRVPLLLLLAAGCVSIRWAGVLQFLTVGACLMHGRAWWRILDRGVLARWTIIAGLIAASAVTFFALRQYLQLTKEQAIAAAEAGAVFDDTQVVQTQVEAQKLELVNMQITRDRTAVEELWRRFSETGRWFAWLYWQPFRFVATVSFASWVDIAVGWLAVFLLAVSVVLGCARRQWVWLGAAFYCAALLFNWPNPNARYLVPLAPLLIAGIFVGLRPALTRWMRGDGLAERGAFYTLVIAAVLFTLLNRYSDVWPYRLSPLPLWALAAAWAFRIFVIRNTAEFRRRAYTLAGWTFAVSVVGCSTTLYAIDLTIFRSDRFYDRYEAGFHEQLIQACYQLNQMDLRDNDLAVSERYQNLGRTRKSKYAVRAAALLTNRVVLTVPDRLTGEPPKAELLRWAQRRKVTYYINQKPNWPWRVWHFVLPRWLNQRLIDAPLPADSGGWTLFALSFRKTYLAPPPEATAGWPGSFRPPTTLPTVWPEPPWEMKRNASMVRLPNVRDWPKRVPGM